MELVTTNARPYRAVVGQPISGKNSKILEIYPAVTIYIGAGRVINLASTIIRVAGRITGRVIFDDKVTAFTYNETPVAGIAAGLDNSIIRNAGFSIGYSTYFNTGKSLSAHHRGIHAYGIPGDAD